MFSSRMTLQTEGPLDLASFCVHAHRMHSTDPDEGDLRRAIEEEGRDGRQDDRSAPCRRAADEPDDARGMDQVRGALLLLAPWLRVPLL
eukprot:1334242-Pleurochrysis_carterae.AAC.6